MTSPTFKYYRKDRTSNSGGVIAWIRSDIPHCRLPDLEFDSYEDHIESMVFELKIKKGTWYLIFNYKNPKTSNKLFINKLKVAYESFFNKGKIIVLSGDLNIDLHEPENDLDINLCHMYNIQNRITDSTCFKKQEGTLIDPILVKNPRKFKGSINVYCGFSDWQYIVGCITKVQLPTFNPLRVTYRNYKICLMKMPSRKT